MVAVDEVPTPITFKLQLGALMKTFYSKMHRPTRRNIVNKMTVRAQKDNNSETDFINQVQIFRPLILCNNSVLKTTVVTTIQPLSQINSALRLPHTIIELGSRNSLPQRICQIWNQRMPTHLNYDDPN